MSITAVHRGVCGKCGDHIEPGDQIEPSPVGWAHTDCPDELLNVDDRPRCRFCGDLLTPDFECENCPGV